MELQLKHLAPYLPYGLKLVPNNYRSIAGGYGYYHRELDIDALSNCNIDDLKPILRPMSDLTKAMLREAGFDTHIDYLTNELQNDANDSRVDGNGKKLWRVESAPYEMVAFLFANHFDVFGLIPAGLAINLNELDHATNP